jgi:uncharacterized RDD family membrane protein YckC
MNPASDARADELLGRRRRSTRLLVTPDGVPLRIEIAELTERLAAFAIDLMITGVAAQLLLFVAIVFSGGRAGGLSLAAWAFVAFLLRNAYFVCFELGWAGVTPGKRVLGLRVIDRHGETLRPGAVAARNLSREAETFFPLAMIFQAAHWIAASWEIVPVALWLLLTSVLPLVNRDRLRAGDLIGGTVVIVVPKHVLLDELVVQRSAFAFADDHLQRYGILELQVLEDVLRRPHTSETDRLLAEIATKVRGKIQWAGTVREHESRTFLRDFYAAQRAFLELRKHLGDERADKFHGTRAER